jgi:subfamily B ATP-binding cassette protein MsbA
MLKTKIAINLNAIDILYPYLKKNRQLLVFLIVLPILIGFFDGVIAWSLKPYIDTLMNPSSSYQIYLIPGILLISGIIQAFLSFRVNLKNEKLGLNISNYLKLVMFEKLIKNDASFFDKSTSGQIQSNFNNDIENNCAPLMINIKSVVNQLASITALLGVIFSNSWILSLISLGILTPMIYFIKSNKNKLKKKYYALLESDGDVSTLYNETFAGNRIISSFNLSNIQIDKVEYALKHNFNCKLDLYKIRVKHSFISYILATCCISLTILTGGILIKKNLMTIGSFFSFYTSLLLIIKPFKAIGSTYQLLQENLFGLERIKKILNSMPTITDKPNSIRLDTLKNDIEYKNVYFEYQNNTPILKNINLVIKKGEKIAIVGNSGGGKTTIMNLLARFYDVTSGTISIDDINVKDYKLDSLRDNIAIVFQDNFLFSGTIKENIILGRTDISDEQIFKVLKYSYLDEFVGTLKQGIHTEIGERGIRLSGGQKQRLAIARIFIKDAPILILDEATSSLDSKSELFVRKAIENLTKGRTVFIIAHRISTVMNADKIIVIKNGHIIEQGKHEELLEKNNFYTSIYYPELKKQKYNNLKHISADL